MVSFDDPSQVEAAKLRSHCGLLLPTSCHGRAVEVMAKIAEGGLKVEKREMKPARALHAHFPFRNTLSYMIAPMKVYPAAR
mmetsp:Transcript_129091/g.413705  ORF Transcript_129091/g.413705 Transcript_129091/m.413705 type:complete len:81 (-) Transcript_129091:462-704(-)|eukprot:CAMPEP_0204164240 /NCGR_PEP_ID=MMETSP0361-20130328/37119_1 /ASSEMBLY_ACC=CAM_ASM_000343 /TAXON_ID=268821 /ORGANISM="Scrippsiella Hangoei, Strain SHTV-5" /LENGTH=80 /DNA_ID=CAMNT_0051121069 /DNA_START=269 /DNA_END=511 /DNA_ORIENTATION=+